MKNDQVNTIAAASGNHVYDIAQGDIHLLVRLILLQVATVTDLISENQGDNEALHFALHIHQGAEELVRVAGQELS